MCCKTLLDMLRVVRFALLRLSNRNGMFLVDLVQTATISCVASLSIQNRYVYSYSVSPSTWCVTTQQTTMHVAAMVKLKYAMLPCHVESALQCILLFHIRDPGLKPQGVAASVNHHHTLPQLTRVLTGSLRPYHPTRARQGTLTIPSSCSDVYSICCM
jgi:hypothetical protein